MNESGAHSLHSRLTESQAKYAYFLLAIAAAAIGLVVRQTQEARFQLAQIPLAAAVLCYGASFFCGCKYIQWMNATMRANVALLQIQEGKHPGLPNHPQLIEAAADGVRQAAETNSAATAKYSRWQFRLLIAGAVFYLVWHVATMWGRSFS
ncbi:MAG TPA: hypothetical protein VES88_06725 [Gemmatimonadaceae bacterium]|nr:hypothetical protein [Gemmatimonadaceae bacterium]